MNADGTVFDPEGDAVAIADPERLADGFWRRACPTFPARRVRQGLPEKTITQGMLHTAQRTNSAQSTVV
jgi:hypothetical protein